MKTISDIKYDIQNLLKMQVAAMAGRLLAGAKPCRLAGQRQAQDVPPTQALHRLPGVRGKQNRPGSHVCAAGGWAPPPDRGSQHRLQTLYQEMIRYRSRKAKEQYY